MTSFFNLPVPSAVSRLQHKEPQFEALSKYPTHALIALVLSGLTSLLPEGDNNYSDNTADVPPAGGKFPRV